MLSAAIIHLNHELAAGTVCSRGRGVLVIPAPYSCTDLRRGRHKTLSCVLEEQRHKRRRQPQCLYATLAEKNKLC